MTYDGFGLCAEAINYVHHHLPRLLCRYSDDRTGDTDGITNGGIPHRHVPTGASRRTKVVLQIKCSSNEAD